MYLISSYLKAMSVSTVTGRFCPSRFFFFNSQDKSLVVGRFHRAFGFCPLFSQDFHFVADVFEVLSGCAKGRSQACRPDFQFVVFFVAVEFCFHQTGQTDAFIDVDRRVAVDFDGDVVVVVDSDVHEKRSVPSIPFSRVFVNAILSIIAFSFYNNNGEDVRPLHFIHLQRYFFG